MRQKINKCVEYVKENLDPSVDLDYTYSKMCVHRTPLRMEDSWLYNHISDLIEDFKSDYDMEMYDFDIDYIFDKLIGYDYEADSNKRRFVLCLARNGRVC